MENITHIILVKIILFIANENEKDMGKKQAYPVV